MRIAAYSYLVIACFLGWSRFAGGEQAADAILEDLSSCPLPSGTTEIPQRNSPRAGRENEYIFKFSNGRLMSESPMKGNKIVLSATEILKTIRDQSVGDLLYAPNNGGTFIAISGRMADVGEGYLYSFGEKELVRPSEVVGRKENKAGIPGAIEGVFEGHCYFVETVDGKFALIRLISQGDRTAKIQWVYQPDGSRAFNIPQGKLLPPSSEKVEKKAPDHTPKPAEDLSKCTIPHGTAILAREYTAKSHEQNGSFFKFADGKCHFGPYEQGKNPKPSAMLQSLRDHHTGDIFYFKHKGGGLVSISGRILDLGEHFLWEFDRKELPRPEVGNYWSEDNDKLAGVANPVETGHCYLVETVDGRFALVRPISVDDLGFATVQWAYQPDGTRTFGIPKGEIMAQGKGSRTEMVIGGSDKTVEGGIEPALHREEPLDLKNIEDAIELHVAARNQLIEALVVLLKQNDQKLSEASSDQRKRMAMSALALGSLRAFEATEILVNRIALGDPEALSDDARFESVSAMALVSIGKPATHAIVEAMQRITSRQDRAVVTAFERSPEFIFSCSVLVEVEGKAVAEFLLKSEMAKDNDEGRRLYRKALGLIELGLPACGSLETSRQFRPKAQGELGKLQEAVESHLANRVVLIDALLKYLNDRPKNAPDELPLEQIKMMCSAILALGKMRAPEATDVLLNGITFRDTAAADKRAEYPSVLALVDIGKPATRAIAARLQKAASNEDQAAALELENSQAFPLYCTVLSGIEGKAVAEFVLKTEMEKVKEERRGIYRKALELISKQ